MDSFYLLVVAQRQKVKGSKLRQSPKNATRMTRIAKCTLDKFSVHDGVIIGRWYKIDIYDSPFREMLDLVFVGAFCDPGIRAAEALAYRMVSSLSMASPVKWEANCGPIDLDDAVQIRIELEVV
jgi:hypothetical protein